MNIYTDRTKNDLTALALIRLERLNKIWGPGINLRTHWKIFSLRPWVRLVTNDALFRPKFSRFDILSCISNCGSIGNSKSFYVSILSHFLKMQNFVVPHILLFFLFSSLFPLSPLSFSLRPRDCHFFPFFAVKYIGESSRSCSRFRFACCRKHKKLWFMDMCI